MRQSEFSNVLHYLRSFSALLIVAFHTLEPLEVLGGQVQMLRVGSDIFFVLSGFLIWRNVLKHETGPFEFMGKRIIRLAPLYWIITLIAVCLALIKPKLFWMVDTGSLHVLLSLLFIPDYNHNGLLFPSLLNGWMINSLMYLYLCAAIALFLPKSRRLIVLTLFICGSACLHPFFDGQLQPSLKSAILDAYTNPLLLEFVGGLWIAQFLSWIQATGQNEQKLGYVMLGLVFLSLCGIVTAGQISEANFGFYRFIVLGLPACLLVIAAVLWDSKYSVVHIGFLKRIGDASYAMYLVQFLVLAPVLHLTRHTHVLLSFSLCLISVILVSLLLYRYIECPLSDWVQKSVRWKQKSFPAV